MDNYMNVARIKAATETIERRQRALKWLRQYGEGVTGKGDTAASATVRLNIAGACEGAGEAVDIISAYATRLLPEAVKAATECCVNDINMAISAIGDEIARQS